MNHFSKKKIIISETFLNELLTKQNDIVDDSGSSTVYLGDKWVKKTSNDGHYSKAEIAQYSAMALEKNADVFPKTIIKRLQNDEFVILQKKVDIQSAKLIYGKIFNLYESYGNLSFRRMLESIADFGLDGEIEKIISANKKRFDLNNLQWFFQFIDLAKRLNQIISSDPILKKFSADLHLNNFGLENNRLKIIDFIA